MNVSKPHIQFNSRTVFQNAFSWHISRRCFRGFSVVGLIAIILVAYSGCASTSDTAGSGLFPVYRLDAQGNIVIVDYHSQSTFGGWPEPPPGYIVASVWNAGRFIGFLERPQTESERIESTRHGTMNAEVLSTLLKTVGVRKSIPEAVVAGQAATKYATAAAGSTQVTVNNNVASPAIAGNATTIEEVTNLPVTGGGVYSGKVKRDAQGGRKPDGSGILTLTDGRKIEGEFEDGEAPTHCAITFPDGRKYKGSAKMGRPEGEGEQTWPDGRTYSGSWKDGEIDGFGSFRDGDGTRFVGQYKKGLVHGTGTITTKYGGERTGEFREGEEWRMRGTDIWPDGTKCAGEWNSDGTKSAGVITWKDGRSYQGDWRVMEGKPDVPDGAGRLTWPDGRSYVGDFRDGKMHGLGKMTYPDGKVEDGVWRDDRFTGSRSQANVVGNAYPGVSLKAGTLTVMADDSSCEVSIDGSFVGNAPAKMKLVEGRHLIEVRKSGFRDYRKEIIVADGSEQSLRVVLEKN